MENLATRIVYIVAEIRDSIQTSMGENSLASSTSIEDLIDESIFNIWWNTLYCLNI